MRTSAPRDPTIQNGWPRFARYLNVTTGLISQWERGEKHPQGASLKLLSLVARHGLTTVA